MRSREQQENQSAELNQGGPIVNINACDNPNGPCACGAWHKTAVKAYLMHAGNKWFLCFGSDANEAAKGVETLGFANSEIGVSQSVAAVTGTAVEIDCSLNAPLMKFTKTGDVHKGPVDTASIPETPDNSQSTDGPLQLREGAWYEQRDGEVVGPLKLRQRFPFTNDTGKIWSSDGKCYSFDGYDLRREVPPPQQEPRKGPSDEWLREMAEKEDGKCVSVGGLAVELGLYKKHPVEFRNGSWYWGDWLLDHRAYAIKRGNSYLQSDSEHGSGFTVQIRQTWTPSQMTKINASLLKDCVPVCVAELEPFELPEPPQQEPQPDADGWIEWHGGKCPVPDETLVDVRYRNRKEVRSVPANINTEREYDAWKVFWDKQNDDYDITHYRLVKPAPQQYRPFASADEFRPHRDRWIRRCSGDGAFSIQCYSDDQLWSLDLTFTYQELLEYVFDDDGQPCGVEVK